MSSIACCLVIPYSSSKLVTVEILSAFACSYLNKSSFCRYFNKNGWPHSALQTSVPTTDEEKDFLIDSLQDWKTSKYKDLIGSGAVRFLPREGSNQKAEWLHQQMKSNHIMKKKPRVHFTVTMEPRVTHV